MTLNPMEISARKVRAELSSFHISVTDDQISQIHDYIVLLLKWNRSVSLTSVTDPTEIVRRHFGESMFGASLLPGGTCRLADVGTGAGFPGLALKILNPDIVLLLIDSNNKKCAFLSEVVRTLKISGVEILPERFDHIRPETMQLDLVTSRAVGDFKNVLRWSAKALARRGHVMLWVGADDSTRISTDASWTWQPAVRLPESQRRFILIGRPLHQAS